MNGNLEKAKTKTITKVVGSTLPEKDEIKVEDKIIGKHFYGNLYDLDMKRMEDMEYLKKLVTDAINIAGMTLVEVKAWSFGGKKGGISVIALITESHVALHIWKEYNYATLDLYTCGMESDPEKAFDHIVKGLRTKNSKKFFADRSM